MVSPGSFGGSFLKKSLHGDSFATDPSLKKMKEDISLKEAQNVEMADEIARLKYML